MVLDAAGREVARAETPFTSAAGRSRSSSSSGCSVATPRLWSVETPNLYTLRTEVLERARSVADTVTTPFGIRTIAFDKDRGFLLNGRRVKLNGVNLHHDGGAARRRRARARLGAPPRAAQGDGRNAIRTSHNPPAPEFLDLCDRMGFLVMDEAFDEWTVGKVPEGYHKYFAEWSERDVTDFVHRDRNHPVDRAVERRQRDRRAGHARRARRCCAGSWTSSTARTRRGRSPPATTTSPPTAAAPRSRS